MSPIRQANILIRQVHSYFDSSREVAYGELFCHISLNTQAATQIPYLKQNLPENVTFEVDENLLHDANVRRFMSSDYFYRAAF